MQENLIEYTQPMGKAELIRFAYANPKIPKENLIWLEQMRTKLDLMYLKSAFPANRKLIRTTPPVASNYGQIKALAKARGMLWDPDPAPGGKQPSTFATHGARPARSGARDQGPRGLTRYTLLRKAAKEGGWRF